MDVASWIDSLPNNPCPERDKAILEIVEGGFATYNWLPVTSTHNGHTAIFQVCDDAVRVEGDDGTRFRFQVSAILNQHVADLLDASMATAKIADLSYSQADTKLDYVSLLASPQMDTIDYSKNYNKLVESKRNNGCGLIRDTGKYWLLDNSISVSAGAVNYGFYTKTGNTFKVIQSLGHMHNALHQDYSQTCFVMSNKCKIDGQDAELKDVATDNDLSYLLNYNGVLKYLKQPGS